ncbi:MAG: hypothetical protein IKE64_02095 [Thermoguttaceae bacterium]|nr:hypothetical protein [Thermoguttaceae bacterium]
MAETVDFNGYYDKSGFSSGVFWLNGKNGKYAANREKELTGCSGVFWQNGSLSA